MTAEKKSILKELKQILEGRFGGALIDVVLFGSQLKGSDNADSDFDVLIILEETPGWKVEREIFDLCYDIDLKYGIITDVHVLSKSDLSEPKGRQPIFVNALADGMHV
ncbi:MAG: nucleotidyltransferase domain-containing protein [Planctomycetota bacterium]|jgi:predicted nucleotidyltransferase